MLTFSGTRAYDAGKMMEFIREREWGLVVLDEVHVVPAEMFKKVLTLAPAHCKLGLTATLVREDDKIDRLNYLIGPKLFEANWMELSRSGFIADVECCEVLCPMTAEFFREWVREKDSRKKHLLTTLNPTKVRTCAVLVGMHLERGDKVIVFSDNVFSLKLYASTLGCPFIYGGTSQSERMRILQTFRASPGGSCIFLSKVGDTSLDLPEASVLIQVSGLFGSRRQEAQRLGRILRAKERRVDAGGGRGLGKDAWFYSLVSKDTEEVYYAAKRRGFLVDQGYSFKVITDIPALRSTSCASSDLPYSTLEKQIELLHTVLVQSEKTLDDDEAADVEVDEDGMGAVSKTHLTLPTTYRV
ncbi:hypothetical protein HK097_006481 [Rhizophlyctis rosea]|uniref:DNA helicase n=1 Tax=Rhizophlyctis rosea TaxID=64517 RepID=A0AAD5S0Y6_9FUNG|nr:hypothetical protein HK097_006481 [Rhizophlyctis rosea]